MLRILIIISIVLLTLIFLILVISFVCYRIVFYNSKRNIDMYSIPSDEQFQKSKDIMIPMISDFAKKEFEEITIINSSKMKLYGRYYHHSDDAPLAICFHGYKGHAIRDFCGGSRFLFESKHNLLVVDQRAHTNSDGHTITFGVLESNDVLDWVNYAQERFSKDKKIILYGVSMGAATVLMSLPLVKDKVVACVADCPYDSPKNIIRKVCKVDMKLPINLLYPFIYLGALIYGHFNLESNDAIRGVKDISLPILIIHGEDDRFVPCDMSKNLKKINPNIELYTFPNAGHGLSYIEDEKRYINIANEFLKKVK